MIGVYTKNIGNVWFGVGSDERSIYATTFAFEEKEVLHGLLDSVPFDVPFQHLEMTSTFADQVMALLRDIFDGKDVAISFRLATGHLSDYTRKVIRIASSIPVGYVASYGGVAKVAGGGPRAVGRVMALKSFPPIVPWHRVVSSGFTLGGYSGGLGVMLDLLKRESRGYSSKREIAVGGKTLQVFPVEFVLKRLARDKR